MTVGTVVVFGGSGFIGRYTVRRLATAGWRVIVAVRRPHTAAFLQTAGDVGQIVVVATDIADERQVNERITGADAVVNLVGILYEKGQRTFARMHGESAGNVARAAAEAGVRAMVHVSAIGASSRALSAYARSKAAAEEAVRAVMPDAVILRPSIVFGPEDRFFNLFAHMAARSPVIPLIGGGATRFQPVYVDDVAAAIVAALDDDDARRQDFELGGPAVMTFRHFMEFIRRETGRCVVLLPLPFAAARVVGRLLERLPRPPLTYDQVLLLESDNVVAMDAANLKDLGIEATAVELVVPSYLAVYRRGAAAG